MPSSTNPRPLPKDRRELLLDAALELFARQPFDAVSLADIAAHAGVAYGLIGHYFGGKRGIYLAAIEAMAQRLRAVRDQAPRAGQDPVDALREGVARHVAYLASQAAGFVALMRGGLGADPEVREAMDTLRREGAQRVLVLLGARLPPPPSLRTAMRAWVGLLDEAVLDWLEHRDVSAEDLVRFVLRALATCAGSVDEQVSGIPAERLRRLARS